MMHAIDANNALTHAYIRTYLPDRYEYQEGEGVYCVGHTATVPSSEPQMMNLPSSLKLALICMLSRTTPLYLQCTAPSWLFTRRSRQSFVDTRISLRFPDFLLLAPCASFDDADEDGGDDTAMSFVYTRPVTLHPSLYAPFLFRQWKLPKGSKPDGQ